MSLNVLNKRFLSLLNELDIDIYDFPDQSFDGLFESKQSDLNYFLEWFIDNITSEHVLTGAEIDIINAHKNSFCKTDDELEFELKKCKLDYDDLEDLNENYILNELVGMIQDVNVEYKGLLDISAGLEKRHNEVKRHQNSMKEECHSWKKKLTQLNEEVECLGSDISLIEKDIENFEIFGNISVENLQGYKNRFQEICSPKELSNFDFFEVNYFSPLSADKQVVQFSKLQKNLNTSKYLRAISKSLLEATEYKISKAEEFLTKLKDNNESHFTFDEVLKVWCDTNEIKTTNNLENEIHSILENDLTAKISEDCDHNWNKFLSQSYYNYSNKNQKLIVNSCEFINYIKHDIVSNLLFSQVLTKSIENRKICADSMEKLHIFLYHCMNRVKNGVDALEVRCKQSEKYQKHINENHVLSESCKKIESKFSEKVGKKNLPLTKAFSVIQILTENSNFYQTSFFRSRENSILSSISSIACGPTTCIQLAPIDLHLTFFKCDEQLSEFSHLVQRLLTEYVNTKEAISSSDRRHMLLWIDFLINPKKLVTALENIQEQAVNSGSKVSAAKPTP